MKKLADNLIEIPEKNMGNYKKLKEGDDIKSGDYVNIFDETYAEIGKGNIITKCDKSLENIYMQNIKTHFINLALEKDKSYDTYIWLDFDIIKIISDVNIIQKNIRCEMKPLENFMIEKMIKKKRKRLHFRKSKLDENFDCCGVNYRWWPVNHFSGGFWWANSDYIKTLPEISEIDHPGAPQKATLRHNAEFWIGMKNPKMYCIFNSGMGASHYDIPYPKENYV